MKIRTDFVLNDIGQLLTIDGSGSSGIGILTDAALAMEDGKVVWVGSESDLETCCSVHEATETVSAGGLLVTPGFVDSHTHPLFGATRQDEFAMRAAGADYEEIAAAGGGILNSVKRTRLAAGSLIRNDC